MSKDNCQKVHSAVCLLNTEQRARTLCILLHISVKTSALARAGPRDREEGDVRNIT